MRPDGKPGMKMVIGVAAAVVVVATGGMAMSSRSALQQARQRADAQDALIASLTAELETARRERSAMEPALPLIPITVSSADAQPEGDVADHALTTELAAREREVSRLLERVAELEAAREPRQAPTDRADRMQAWRERMQQQDPEAYERRRQEGREMVGRIADTTRNRLQFMQSIPTDGLAPDYLENHNALLERLAFYDQAMAQIAEDPENPANRELMPQMVANMRGLNEMLQMQREVLLDDLARDIGYEGEAAGHFVAAVNAISEMTTMPGPGQWRRVMRTGSRGGRQPQPSE